MLIVVKGISGRDPLPLLPRTGTRLPVCTFLTFLTLQKSGPPFHRPHAPKNKTVLFFNFCLGNFGRARWSGPGRSAGSQWAWPIGWAHSIPGASRLPGASREPAAICSYEFTTKRCSVRSGAGWHCRLGDGHCHPNSNYLRSAWTNQLLLEPTKKYKNKNKK